MAFVRPMYTTRSPRLNPRSAGAPPRPQWTRHRTVSKRLNPRSAGVPPRPQWTHHRTVSKRKICGRGGRRAGGKTTKVTPNASAHLRRDITGRRRVLIHLPPRARTFPKTKRKIGGRGGWRAGGKPTKGGPNRART